MRGLGKGFEGGAKLVPSIGDGNCFFRSVSTYLTCSKDNKLGTQDRHGELREQVCDYIVKERNSKLMQGIWARRKNKLESDEDFNAYIANKRSTGGGVKTWSDGATANGMAAICGKGPILQCIYPKYRNGEPCPEEPPKFYFLSKLGDRTKLPIYIHYNGHNHYNAIVPASYVTTSPRRSVSPKGAAKATAPFGHQFSGMA